MGLGGLWNKAKKTYKKAERGVRKTVKRAARGTPFAGAVNTMTKMKISDPKSISRGFAAGRSIVTKAGKMGGTVATAFATPTPDNISAAGKALSGRGGKRRGFFKNIKAQAGAAKAISKASAGVEPPPMLKPPPAPVPKPVKQAATVGVGALAIKLLLF